MSDADGLLLAILRQCRGTTVLVADENCLDFPFQNLEPGVQVLSNRFDVAGQATAAGLNVSFSDFDFSSLHGAGISNIVYRLSKEKAVVHHIANQAGATLETGGRLWLVGGKQEGIKTFGKTVGRQFGTSPIMRKEGQMYLAEVQKTSPDPPMLDDKDYDRLREILELQHQPVLSKPGLFGWNKIDRGSELLAGYLPELLARIRQKPSPSLLDLGCGYGYLSLAANELQPFSIVATDNCAAAIIACRENFRIHQVQGTVIADDCGSGLAKSFDLILCNPPFHQGFQQERKLTEKFLGNTRRLLAVDGRALFVVNQFVPLDSLARNFFPRVEVPLVADGFKLVEMEP